MDSCISMNLCRIKVLLHDREVQAGAIYLSRLFLQHLPEHDIIH